MSTNKPILSFEFFPPKTPEGMEKLRATQRQLAQLNPEFFSVTFGAGGSTRDRTLETVLEIQASGYNEDTETVVLEGSNVTYRATYLIDEEGKVFHESVNDMPLGRNVNEYLRLVDAYTHVQVKGEVCPANWEEGKEAMTADRSGVASYLASN